MGSNDDITQVTPARSDFATGIRADLVAKLTPDIELVPGVRVDTFVSGADAVPSVNPRVAARIGIVEGVRTVHTFGVAHQPPSFIVPWPGFRISGLESGCSGACSGARESKATSPKARPHRSRCSRTSS